MSTEFLPIFMCLMLLVMFGLPAVIVKKAQEQQRARQQQARRNPSSGAQQAPEAPPAPAPQPEREPRLTPSISLTGHDDSIYQGSMNAVTGEGYDPCHEEQMTVLDLAEEPEHEPRPAQGGNLPLGWTANDMVRGIVMSEILNRKKPVNH